MKWYGWPWAHASRGELQAAILHPSYRREDGREVARLLDWDGEAFSTLSQARHALVSEMRREPCSESDCRLAARITARDVPVVHDYREEIAAAAGNSASAGRRGPPVRDRRGG